MALGRGRARGSVGLDVMGYNALQPTRTIMPLDIDKELAALERMTAGHLAERSSEQTYSRHQTYLIRKILWKFQTREVGGLSERALKRANELAANAALRVMPPATLEARPVSEVVATAPVTRDSRLPLPGASLVREYKGQRIEVTVLPDGFEDEGKRYRTCRRSPARSPARTSAGSASSTWRAGKDPSTNTRPARHPAGPVRDLHPEVHGRGAGARVQLARRPA